ncbi:HAMP domain-containing sensor histidine kinase [Pseudomonas sp. GOM6]|uniref:sensor histidine kinase n=1 Tax=Pseudomonas sp. GOM6 TaxID=3036944 RepID=UPI00240A9719|nr:HAMP domain-containing sensor histidine kinase [Pseudomonas sp. GOM6]MDG1579381.1 HAMP domain-containing sensor histidine kinase [Pseudomonas sp. GOM6]
MSGLDIATVIASTVHDMKNSLALLGQSHARWLAQLPAELQGGAERGVIEYEFARLNGMLVQLLGLYKLGVNQLPLFPAHHELDDFIGAQLARHQDVLDSRGIAARGEVESFDLMGFFDQELIGSVLANVIANSIRYARSALLISAREEGGELLLCVNDDGAGYPQAMIEQQGDYVLGLNQSSGSTGLGLYFAARIAELHRRGERCGRIELGNGGPLGGGEFRIYLP